MLSFISAAMMALLLSANVTKEDVRRLLNAGVPEQTLVEYIYRNAPADPLSVDDVMELKAAGATDAVISAMLEASRTAEAVAPSTPDSSSYGSDSSNYPSTTYYDAYPDYSSYSYPYASYDYPYSYPYYSYVPYYSYPYYRYPYYYHYRFTRPFPNSVSPFRNPHPQQTLPQQQMQQQPMQPQQTQPRPQPTQPRSGSGTFRH